MSFRELSLERLPLFERIRQFFGIDPSSTWAPYVFLLPFLVLFATFFAYPLLWAVFMSFHTFNFMSGASFVGIDHYVSILSGGGFFLQSLGVTLTIAAITIPLQVGLSLVLAVLMDSAYARFKRLMRTGYLLPMVTSATVIAMVFNLLLRQGGLMDLLTGNLLGTSFPYLSDPLWAKVSIALVQAWKWMGLFVLVYVAGLQNIDQDLYRAAQVDGANRLQQWWHITIPQLRPIIILVLMIATTRTIRIFDIPLVLTNGGPGVSTRTLVIYIYQQAFEAVNLGRAAAIAVIFSLLLGSLLYVQHEYGEMS
jgi:ABC-type sugar transport system permease subunit